MRAAAISSDLPLEADGERRAFTPEHSSHRGPSPAVAVTWVHGDFFSTYGVPLLRGRHFSTDEQNENRRVAVVNRRLAEMYWPGEDAVGKRFKWGIPASTAPWQTVIAVASDVVDGPVGTEPPTHIYVPYAEISDQALQAPISGLLRRLVVAVNSDRDPRAFAAAVRLAVAANDRALATARVQSIAELGRDRTAPQRFSALVFAGFAGGALILAAIGLYGILAFAVSQRKREIGVRMALGAQRRDVLRLVVRQGMRLVALGLLIGGAGAVAASRLLATQLYETSVHDPLTFAGVPLVLGLVAMLACYLPARRAAGLDPIEAVRPE